MSRRPSTPAPRYTLADAVAACRHIHTIRIRATDPDLGFFPQPVDDDDDVARVAAYTVTHRRVRPLYLAEEIPHRAVLVEYERQTVEARTRRHRLALLTDAHQLGVPWTAYGPAVGLPSCAAVVNRRNWLRAQLHAGPASLAAAPAGDHDPVQAWLAQYARALLDVAGALVDHRDALVASVPVGGRAAVTEAIDVAGSQLAGKPTRTLARAVAYAAFHLRTGGAGEDPDLAEVVCRAGVLRDGYEAVAG